MRAVFPWLVGGMTLVALWPALCVSSEGGDESCQSALFLPLPWGRYTDTLGFVVAIGAALLASLTVRRLLRRL